MRRELHGPLVILEFMGLQFFSLKRLEHGENLRGPSTFRAVYMFAVISFLVLITYAISQTNYFVIEEGYSAHNALEVTILRVLCFGLLMVVLTNSMLSFVTTKSVKKFFLDSEEMSQTMHRDFNSSFDFEKLKRSTRKLLIGMTIAFFILHVVSGAFQLHSPDNITSWALGIPIVMLLFVTVYKFVFYVDFVNAQLEKLTTLLEKLFNQPPLAIVDAFDLKSPNFRALSLLKVSEKKLRTFRDVYCTIHGNSMIVNASNGLPMLILISCLVVSLTVSGYEMFIGLAVENGLTENIARE